MPSAFVSVWHEGRTYRAYLTPSGIGRICTIGTYAGHQYERDLTSAGPRREAIAVLAAEKVRR